MSILGVDLSPDLPADLPLDLPGIPIVGIYTYQLTIAISVQVRSTLGHKMCILGGVDLPPDLPMHNHTQIS